MEKETIKQERLLRSPKVVVDIINDSVNTISTELLSYQDNTWALLETIGEKETLMEIYNTMSLSEEAPFILVVNSIDAKSLDYQKAKTVFVNDSLDDIKRMYMIV
jgi:hypothetical protein